MPPRPWPRRGARFWTFAAVVVVLVLVLVVSLVIALSYLISLRQPLPTGGINAIIGLFAACLLLVLVGFLVLFFSEPEARGRDPDPEARHAPPPPGDGGGPAAPAGQPSGRDAAQPGVLQQPVLRQQPGPRTWRPAPPYLQPPTRFASPRELPGDAQPARRARAPTHGPPHTPRQALGAPGTAPPAAPPPHPECLAPGAQLPPHFRWQELLGHAARADYRAPADAGWLGLVTRGASLDRLLAGGPPGGKHARQAGGAPGPAGKQGSPQADRCEPPGHAGRRDRDHQHQQQPERRRGSDSGYGMSSPEHAAFPVSPLSQSPRSPVPRPGSRPGAAEGAAAAEQRADAAYQTVWRALFPRLMDTVQESPPPAAEGRGGPPAGRPGGEGGEGGEGASRRRTSSAEPLASFAERVGDHERRRRRQQRQQRRSKSSRRRASDAGCGYS